MKLWIAIVLLATVLVSCKKDDPAPVYKTKNVIIVVVDGARSTETWLDPTQQNIPHQAALLSEGCLITNFRNNGPTWTMSGHGALVTGQFRWINNGGDQSPSVPTIFQQFRKQKSLSEEKVWIVASKGKVAALANCIQKDWYNQYVPQTNCGIGGAGVTSGYREDSLTFSVVLGVMHTYHPRMMLVNFRQPDYSGHQADSIGYINGIKSTDAYIGQLWEWIQNDPEYKDKTTLIVTSDHGRHSDGIADGFVSHGDGCEGCRRLTLFAIGPDFRKNNVIYNAYEQTDLSATLGKLLNFNIPDSKGKAINELFR